MTENVLQLRRARAEDCRRIWEWRNEDVVRALSLNSDLIPYENHEYWFLKKLQDPKTKILLGHDVKDCLVGYVRFHIEDVRAEISVCIDSSQRGKGYGTGIIRSGVNYLFSQQKDVQEIVAYIRFENVPSIFAFQKAGFKENGTKKVSGLEVREMVCCRECL